MTEHISYGVNLEVSPNELITQGCSFNQRTISRATFKCPTTKNVAKRVDKVYTNIRPFNYRVGKVAIACGLTCTPLVEVITFSWLGPKVPYTHLVTRNDDIELGQYCEAYFQTSRSSTTPTHYTTNLGVVDRTHKECVQRGAWGFNNETVTTTKLNVVNNARQWPCCVYCVRIKDYSVTNTSVTQLDFTLGSDASILNGPVWRHRINIDAGGKY
ncbi:hypothetical protein D3C81_1333240 [compost metagenome]